MLKKLVIGKWETTIGEAELVPETVILELEDFLTNQWSQAAMEDVKEIGSWWWGAKELGLPSPIVRVDMAPTLINPSKRSIYEVEVRPAGLGTALTLLPGERSQWKEVLKKSGCQGFVSLETSVQDDGLAAELLEIPYFEEFPFRPGPFWIRTAPDDPRAQVLEGNSLVPIRMDGYKGYLLRLGLATSVKDCSELPWESGFVIKPLQGARMEGIEIWLPQERPGRGLSTKTRISRRLQESTPYLLQPFVSPKEEEYEGRQGWTIWRLFFGRGFLGWRERYFFIGGIWNWRPNFRVHGASDAIMGPVEVSK